MTIQMQRSDICPTVKVVAIGPRYTAQEIEAALPQVGRAPSSRPAPEAPQWTLINDPANLAVVKDAVAHMAGAQPALWQGQWASIKDIGARPVYPSQSEADMALASHIANHLQRQDVAAAQLPELVEAVFSHSGLAVREKWQVRSDYRRGTVGKACMSAMSVSNGGVAQATVDWGLHGDIRNAKFFADSWKEKLIHVPELNKWMEWEEGRWTECFANGEVEYAKKTCSHIYVAAGATFATEPDKARKWATEAISAHNLPRINAMLELAKSDPALAVSSARLDADPLLLGVGNGVVDLRTGLVQPNSAELYITRHCAADYNPAAECPRWHQFLEEVFCQDKETIASVQRLLGYSLTGLSREELMVFCVGFGANGKSIFGNVISAIMGPYAKIAPSGTLAARRADDHSARGDVAMLDGARLVSINELPAGMQLDEQVVKQLAGREAISARRLYGDYFTFQPQFTAWVRTNHKPIVKGDDDGIWRRIVLLPFRRKFEEHEQNPNLEAELLKERDGILSWMVEGAKQYLRGGIRLSPTMKAEQNSYRKDSDMIGEFLEERTTARPGERVEQGLLYSHWKGWCEQNGTQPGAKKTFTQRITERGFEVKSSNGQRFYSGLVIYKAFRTATVQVGRD